MHRFLPDRSGNAAIGFAIAVPMLVAAVGAATAYSEGARLRTAAQESLDAAVLAGTSLPVGVSPADRVLAARRAFEANAAPLVRSGLMSSEPTFDVRQGLDSQFLVSDVNVSGAVRFTMRNMFGGFFGSETIDIAVRAAARKQLSEPICVLAVNRQMPRALEIYGNSVFNVSNCAVQTNSSNGSAMKQYGRAEGRARQFGVSGGYEGSAWSPLPNTGVETIADPFRNLPAPQAGPCVTGVDQRLQQANVTLDPGTYCGGLDIKTHSRVRLNPGIYIMHEGLFQVGSQAVVEGEDVLIVFSGADSYLYMNGGATLRLTSPRSGAYMNMQMMSDRSLTGSRRGQEWSTILGGARLEFDGTLYLPEHQLWVSGSQHQAVVVGRSPGMIAVADTFWVQGNAVFDFAQENRRNLPIAAEPPRFRYGARLVN
jgi:Flp pilus assembly protein TadG